MRVRMLREHLRHHGNPRADRCQSHETREHLALPSLTVGMVDELVEVVAVAVALPDRVLQRVQGEVGA